MEHDPIHVHVEGNDGYAKFAWNGESFFLTHKELNVAEFAARNYINGFKKPSKEREQYILSEIHKLGEQYTALAY